MEKLEEKASPIWIKQQLDYWREQLKKRPKDKATRREYANFLATARELGITVESMIQRMLDGESIEEIVDEITKSGAIPGLPQPMAVVRDPRYTDYEDDEEEDDDKARKRRAGGSG